VTRWQVPENGVVLLLRLALSRMVRPSTSWEPESVRASSSDHETFRKASRGVLGRELESYRMIHDNRATGAEHPR
jgi:hypothetical protein